jgi:hypothetical protein
MVVTAADKKANTKAYQLYKTGHKGYKAASHLGETALDEKTLTSAETKEKERLVKSMKDKAGDFEKRYPGRGKEVMYATATKMAKKIAEQAMEIQPKAQKSVQQDASEKKVAQQKDKQKQQEVQILQRKLQALRSAPRGADLNITAGYEPEGELVDEASESGIQRRFQKYGDRSARETRQRQIGNIVRKQDDVKSRLSKVKPESPLGKKLSKKSERAGERVASLQRDKMNRPERGY